MFNGIFLVFNTFLVILCRMITKSGDPVKNEDPSIILTLNRVFNNSIEQMIIFGINLFYCIINVATKE